MFTCGLLYCKCFSWSDDHQDKPNVGSIVFSLTTFLHIDMSRAYKRLTTILLSKILKIISKMFISLNSSYQNVMHARYLYFLDFKFILQTVRHEALCICCWVYDRMRIRFTAWRLHLDIVQWLAWLHVPTNCMKRRTSQRRYSHLRKVNQ